MSKYTTEVRFICENYAGFDESQDGAKVEDVIAASRSKIFDFSYPIFDENYRSVLETKILKHYYTREICCETVGRWKLFLNQTMNEIMPFYNKLYESELIEFNPLFDTNLTTDYHKEGEGDGSKTGSGSFTGNDTKAEDISEQGTSQNTRVRNENSVAWDKYSDTPQGAVTGLDSDRYLTNARKNTADIDTTTTDNGSTSNTVDRDVVDTIRHNTTDNESNEYTNSEDYLHHLVGKTGGKSFSKMIKEYRDTFLNIDMMIIEELASCFFMLW